MGEGLKYTVKKRSSPKYPVLREFQKEQIVKSETQVYSINSEKKIIGLGQCFSNLLVSGFFASKNY